MSESHLLLGAGIGLSLVFWGLPRTAFWLLPGLIWPSYWAFSSAAILSLFASFSLLAPYRDGYFDLRSWEKQNWVLLLFLTGVLGGSLFYPAHIGFFGFCSLFGLLWIRIFRVLRFPLPELYRFPKAFRWLSILVWGLIFYFHYIRR